MASFRSSAAIPAALAAVFASPGPLRAQGVVVDEGSFRVSRPGAATDVESFRIFRFDNQTFRATAQLNSGPRRISSMLVTDSVGSPTEFHMTVTESGKTVSDVVATTRGTRLSVRATSPQGDESMRDYPLGHERSVLLDDDLVHELYFAGLSSRAGSVRIINPRAARTGSYTIAAHGLEPVEVGGQSATGTHLSLTGGGDRRDFWVDSEGRVLRVETSSGIKAVRDELPRKR